MTLPYERYNSVVACRQFLIDLINTPRVPRQIKDRARHILRHYPGEHDMKMACKMQHEIIENPFREEF